MGDIAPSLKFPLSLLERSGIYYKNRLVRNIAITVYIGGLLYIIILAGIQFFNYNGNIFRFVGNLEAFCSYLQQFGKVVYLIYYNKKLLELVDTTRGFQSLFHSKEYTLNMTIYPIQKMHLQLQKMFVLSVFICLAYITVISMLTKALPLGVWNLKQYGYWYTILLNLERILLIPAGFIVTAADTIFLAFCVEVLLQFRQLNCMIRELNTGNGNFHEALKWNIRQQLYLLWLIMAKVENFYLPILAVQYVTIVPLMCTEMYAICESTNLQFSIRAGLTCFVLVMQLALYCIPAEYVTYEAGELGSALYSCAWYTTYQDRQWKELPLVIQNSQHAITFKACGFVPIDASTILAVVKMSWSACCVIRAIKRKAETA